MTDKTRLVFLVGGLEPFPSKQVSDFMASLDLGIEGTAVYSTYRVTLTIEGEVKPDQHYIDILTTAYTMQGWSNVTVIRKA